MYVYALTNTDQGTCPVALTENTVVDFHQHELFCIRIQKTWCHRTESKRTVVPGFCSSL